MCKKIAFLLLWVLSTVSLAEIDDVNLPWQPTIEPPTLRYIVASPRAALVKLPRSNSDENPANIGAAENFARYRGEIKVPVGARVVFMLSPQAEAVWYDDTFGTIGTYLILQRSVPLDVNAPAVEADEDAARKWITIGKDGARGKRHGPSIGRANVAVPVRFFRPGIYRLRAIVRTFARPLRDKPNDKNIKINKPNSAYDHDIIHVLVKVVDLSADDIIPDEPASLEPDIEFGFDLPGINEGPAAVIPLE